MSSKTFAIRLALIVSLCVLLTPPVPMASAGSHFEGLIARYEEREPTQWGERVDGVVNRFIPDGEEIALTLDACGSTHGCGYDRKLIDFLRENRIPATLFINARWIAANPDPFLELARDPLFDIGNHGMKHLPCSVTGRSAYNIQGTSDPAGIVEEVEGCALEIERLTGEKPHLFRSGTAYYDEVATSLIRDMGYLPTGYSVLGDAGATFPEDKVFSQLMTCVSGDIVLCHMNHPEKETAEGLIRALPVLRERGFRFVLLKDRTLIP